MDDARERGKQTLKMSDHRASVLFAMASLLPAGCLVAAAIWGGAWVVLSFVSMSLLVIAMDRVGPLFDASHGLRGWLPVALTAAHFAGLYGCIWAIGQPSHLNGWQGAVLIITAGLFIGQVSNACAHELIHRPDRMSRTLGTALYCSILNGHHVSAHLLVHHVYAGTAKDPNSAPMGQGFYRYFGSACLAEYRAGLRTENLRRTGHAKGVHPYMIYTVGAALSFAVAVLLAGSAGAIVLLILSMHAQMQLLLSDYLQHYGLRRAIDAATGKPEPMGPQHSWNAPQPYSAALMLNAPRHSDHHMHPGRDFTALSHDSDAMPTLPRSVPVMGAIALIPPLWRKIMDPKVQQWSAPSDPVSTAVTMGAPSSSSFVSTL